MMTDNMHTQQSSSTPFGMRLRNAREALGLESKDAAAQLRLNEKIILMLEKDCYATDIPTTFLRGYLRAYGKLLQIPELEIKQAIEPIQPKVEPVAPAPKTQPLTSGNYFVQLFTYSIVFTLIALAGAWWYSHSPSTPSPTPTLVENQIKIPALAATPTEINAAAPTVKANAVSATVNLGAKLADTQSTSNPATTTSETNKPKIIAQAQANDKPTSNAKAQANDDDADDNDQDSDNTD